MSGNRQTPEDGHTLLLMERPQGCRTYADFENIATCFDKFLDIFEKFRESQGLDPSGYVYSDVTQYIDQFYSIEVMVFDREIARYKRLEPEAMKKLLLDQTAKAMAD